MSRYVAQRVLAMVGRRPKHEFRAARRAEQTEPTKHTCRHCAAPLAADGVCSRCYARGKR